MAIYYLIDIKYNSSLLPECILYSYMMVNIKKHNS